MDRLYERHQHVNGSAFAHTVLNGREYVDGDDVTAIFTYIL